MKTLQKYKNEQMKNPEFAKAYEEIQPEMNVIRAIVDARALRNMTQKELSEKTGIAQTEISKLEKGTRNPSIKLLQRLADGMDMVLKVTFVPKERLLSVLSRSILYKSKIPQNAGMVSWGNHIFLPIIILISSSRRILTVS